MGRGPQPRAGAPVNPVLRDYQQETLALVRKAAREGKRPILVLPTGGGKTLTAVLGIVKPSADKGARVLWIAHRAELIDQAAGAMRAAGLRVGEVMGDRAADPEAPVQVASIATLARRAGSLPDARVVIIDEAHHVRSATYMATLAHYIARKAIIIGMTATPERLDGKGLGDVFDEIVEQVTVRELIEHGSLSQYRYYAPHVPDLTGIRRVGGDFSRRGSADVMGKSEVVGNLVVQYQKHLAGQRALVFAVSIAHSLAVVAQFQEAGITAAHLDGTTPERERAATLADFAAGRVLVVSNVDLFDEGFDCPATAGVLIARPTQSLTKHRQMIGRALRPYLGKSHATILDHAGNFLRHGMPDDVLDWSLGDRTEPRETPKAKACPKCYAIVPVHVAECPCCGHRFAVIRPRTGPEFKEGELGEVKQKVWTRAEKVALYAGLLRDAAAKGHMIGFARRKYREQTKVWPRGMAELEAEARKNCDHWKLEAGRCRFCGCDC